MLDAFFLNTEELEFHTLDARSKKVQDRNLQMALSRRNKQRAFRKKEVPWKVEGKDEKTIEKISLYSSRQSNND